MQLNLRLKDSSLADIVEICIDTFPTKSNKKKIGVLVEPPAVYPQFYTKSFFKKFDQIIVMSPWLAERYNLQYWTYQQIEKPIYEYCNDGNRDFAIALMNDHKFSAVNSSRYGFRRELACLLENSNLHFDMFGTNWNMSSQLEFRKRLAAVKFARGSGAVFSFHEAFSKSFHKYRSYIGQAKEKGETLQRYEFSLVIENDIDILSEKLFDVLFAGAIPLYLGPNLSRLGLEELVIRLPEPASSAFEVVESIEASNLDAIRSRINDFIATHPIMKLFSMASISTRIRELIEKDLS